MQVVLVVDDLVSGPRQFLYKGPFLPWFGLGSSYSSVAWLTGRHCEWPEPRGWLILGGGLMCAPCGWGCQGGKPDAPSASKRWDVGVFEACPCSVRSCGCTRYRCRPGCLPSVHTRPCKCVLVGSWAGPQPALAADLSKSMRGVIAEWSRRVYRV